MVQAYVLAQMQVVDSLNNEPIPFTHIRVIKTKSTVLTNSEGYFSLDTLRSTDDTILISSLGYESKKYAVQQLYASSRIALSPKEQQFDVVAIQQDKGKLKLRKLGLTKKPRKLLPDYGVNAYNGMIQAVYIPNAHSMLGVLKHVNVYLTDNGIPNAHFRVHIYDVSLLEIKPDKELTTTNIVVSGAKGNEWVQVDLSKERITVGENGCFVGIEWFAAENSKNYQDTLIYKTLIINDTTEKDTLISEIKRGNGIVLGARYEAYSLSKNKIWYSVPFNDKWMKWSEYKAKTQYNIPDSLMMYYYEQLEEVNPSLHVPCVNITATFTKGKSEGNDMDAENRQFNQLEKVKENLSLYPQSTVVELFNSLIQAFQNDDVIYALKYLCVFKNDELEMFINYLEEHKNITGKYFSEAERKHLIERFHFILDHLKEDSLSQIDSQHFELKVNNHIYNLYYFEGKWKIYPINIHS
ncbi:CarboxypepD_reg-like domain-containing protein [Lishizhenia tianjinensis]|uniref:CarboxypepD_reg-like domain-containing protein n=2 Tax=Lishizhenia tianjinensis TaxID=477690 RepID=A0A1I6Y2B0_9FLAO|nr:CarboxypepD_reg-like domain-containing protein [Lishizhenia tianjinensis]